MEKNRMKTRWTIRKLHEQYPDATFVFFNGLGSPGCDFNWIKKFEKNEVLEHPMYNCEFEFDVPSQPESGSFWIDTEKLDILKSAWPFRSRETAF